MAVDRRHAFATGSVTREADVRLAWPIRSLASALARLLDRHEHYLAWRSFRENAMLGGGVALGASAWCVNYGSPKDIRLGKNVVCRGVLRREAFGNGTVEIGDDAYVGDDCLISCAERVAVGPRTLIAHGVQIFDNDTHPLDATGRRRHWESIRAGGHSDTAAIPSAPIEIGADAWVGFGSIILKGVTMGDGCVIGAGSVVTSDVEPNTIVAGNPARKVRSIGEGEGR